MLLIHSIVDTLYLQALEENFRYLCFASCMKVPYYDFFSIFTKMKGACISKLGSRSLKIDLINFFANCGQEIWRVVVT